LLFTSIWDEPFSLTLLDAMCCEMAIVTTMTGGTPEIAKDQVNCLAFEKDDPASCAERIVRLLKNHEIMDTLKANAKRTIEDDFSFKGMVDSIEKLLNDTIGTRRPRAVV